MLAGYKNKLQQWILRKNPVKKIEGLPEVQYQRKTKEISESLDNLRVECCSIVEQLNKQEATLSEIQEDTTAVVAKIDFLKYNLQTIEKGLKDAEKLATSIDFVNLIIEVTYKTCQEIEDLKLKACSLAEENKKLRTELYIFSDHQEQSEVKVAELEVQNEHLKFLNTLPSAVKSELFNSDDEISKKEINEEYNFYTNPTTAMPFLEEDEYDAKEGAYILSVLDTMDFRRDSRLKVLCDLIKAYIVDEEYDVVIPLLKSTVEDLMSKYEPQDETVLKMMDVLLCVYNLTHRVSDAIKIHEQILQVKQERIPNDEAELAKTLSNLAALNGKMGKITTAKNYSRKALSMRMKIYGDRNLETAKELHNLGVLYSYENQFSKAIECMDDSLNIMKSLPSPDLISLATASLNLGTVTIQNEQLVKAKKHLIGVLKALDINLKKKLEKRRISLSEVLEDENKLDSIEMENREKNKLKRLIRLLKGATEKFQIVSHVEEEISSENVDGE